MRYVGYAFLIAAFCCQALAVNPKLYKFDTGEDFASGDTESVAIDSEGRIHLNRANEVLLEDMPEVWAINDITVIGGKVFVGTSPNAEVYMVEGKKASLIYRPEMPEKTDETKGKEEGAEGQDAEDNKAQQEAKIINEHIFSITSDASGKLVAGVSGEDCRIIKFNDDYSKHEVLCNIEDAAFIFDLAVYGKDLYVATGPQGKIYKISENGEVELFYQCNERGITSLSFTKDTLYVGADKRGVVYKIDIKSKKGYALFDSDQIDITSVNADEEGNVYAIAAIDDPHADKKQKEENKTILPPHAEQSKEKKEQNLYTLQNGGLKLRLAATVKQDMINRENDSKQEDDSIASTVYKIAPDGVVSILGKGTGVFMDSVLYDGNLWIADGKDASLSTVSLDDIVFENIYTDKKCSEITSILVEGDAIYVAMANPCRVVRFDKGLSKEGWWQSDAIDAIQPSLWGDLQLDASIPEGCAVEFAIRSTNIRGASEKDFSEWTKVIPISESAPTISHNARFVQLKLILKGDGKVTPEVNAAAVSAVVRNIKPFVATPLTKKEAESAEILIGIPARDENDDKMVYSIEARSADTRSWITIAKDLTDKKYKWNSITVPDGIYQIRVTASDQPSNSPQNAFESVSTPTELVVDNTAPVINGSNVDITGTSAKITFNVYDKYTVVGAVEYTIDNDENWKNLVPDDLLADTKSEAFTIQFDNLEKGEHIVAVSVSDEANNKRYERFILDIK